MTSTATPAATPFAGLSELVALIDAAVARDDVTETVETIKADLCRLLRSGRIELPPPLTRRVQDHYARRLVHRDRARNYSVVVMTWGPGQCTPIHDHSGMWCVEGVWVGSIDVQQYELVEASAGGFRFEPRNSYQAGVGSAGCLIPPYEYHSISNACSDTTAVTLHIYGGEMACCNVFERQSDGRFRRISRPLPYDD
ncbi:MAG TPA: cysteine dioxygenase family protein [Woeseiaceae bacterium]|nr:cysteine dioxygenase family protein [Woeseiaceae bacterium]